MMAALAAVVATAGCVKPSETSLNDANKQYLESWIQLYHPDAKVTADGMYILEEEEGSGAALNDFKSYPYIRLDYETRNLAGKITDYTSEKIAKQLGDYAVSDFYGPKIWYCGEYNLPVGVENALSTMKAGGSKTVLIPGWLLTTPTNKNKKPIRYKDFDDYFKKESGTNLIYTLRPVERIDDITKWEIDSLVTWMGHNYPAVSPADSLKRGFYFVNLKDGADTKEWPTDTTFKINYIGRLLNGTVFDTNVRDTAKFYDIYKASSKYEPVSIAFAEEYKDIKMSGSGVVDGFAYLISQMHSGQKARGIFYSGWGYGSKENGNTIPPYSPLIFDVEIIR